MRWSAAATVLVLLAYHGTRIAASQCTGAGCDLYIPLSLALPVLAIVMVAVTGVLGTREAKGGWRAAIAVAAVLGVAGPPAALAIWRDSPDVLVPVATALILLCPACIAASSALTRRAG